MSDHLQFNDRIYSAFYLVKYILLSFVSVIFQGHLFLSSDHVLMLKFATSCIASAVPGITLEFLTSLVSNSLVIFRFQSVTSEWPFSLSSERACGRAVTTSCAVTTGGVSLIICESMFILSFGFAYANRCHTIAFNATNHG